MSMEFGDFFNLVTTREKGLAQKQRLRAIWTTASDSIGCVVGEASEFEAKVLVEKLRQVRQGMEETAALIKHISSQVPDYTWLLTIPGFGPYIAALVLASIGNPYRFSNRNQVLKLAGYDLSANRSGKTSTSAVPVLSKKGNSALRYGLYQVALVASSKNQHFIEYYTNTLCGRQREKGIKTKMRVKLAAKMLIIAWTLMKKKEPFDPSYLKKA